MATKRKPKATEYAKIKQLFPELKNYMPLGDVMTAFDQTNNIAPMAELDLRLFSAIMLSPKEDVEELIKAGANVNAVNANGISASELAKAYKRADLKKLLSLEERERIHTPKSKKRKTPKK